MSINFTSVDCIAAGSRSWAAGVGGEVGVGVAGVAGVGGLVGVGREVGVREEVTSVSDQYN